MWSSLLKLWHVHMAKFPRLGIKEPKLLKKMLMLHGFLISTAYLLCLSWVICSKLLNELSVLVFCPVESTNLLHPLLSASLWEGGTSRMTMPTVTHPVPAQSVPIALVMEAFLTICVRRRTSPRCSITAPVPTGQRGRRACWVCRTC